MLYATTRSDHNTFTAQRALKEPCAPDGGLYVPMRLKTLSSQELEVLLDQSAPGILAALMNHFFSTKLSYKDVEFLLGRNIARLQPMNHRITVVELWRNADGDFARIERLLAKHLAVDKRDTPVGEWLKVVCRIGVLFCVYSRMLRDGTLSREEKVDVAVLTGDFTGPMAAWIARKMGLPIGNIVCCSNENGTIWELFQQRQMRCGAPVVKTAAPKCDIVCPAGLERLIRMELGVKEAGIFSEARRTGKDYFVSRELRDPFQGMAASVISNQRIMRVIANVHATNGYIFCPYSAMLYAGLMDFRSNTGSNAQALIISESSPVQCEDTVARALGISVPQLHERLDTI